MEEWLLLVSFHLSVLTYYLGTLIYALPVPWRGLKKWGPEMIYDGAVSATLVFAFTLIVAGVEYLRSLAGGGWEEFYSWIMGRLGIIASYQLLASTIATALGSASGFSLSSLLWPHLRMLSQAAIVLNTLAALGLVVQRFHVRMLALGVLLYAIPFRAARTAGAALMAFTIVFYIALPLMPLFVQSLATNPVEAPDPEKVQLGVVFTKIKLSDSANNPVPYAQLLVEEEGSTLAMYPTDSYGIADAGPPDKGIPNTPFTVRAEYAGLVFNTYPSPVDPSIHMEETETGSMIRLKAPSMLCQAGLQRPVALDDPSPQLNECTVEENTTAILNAAFTTRGGTLYVTLLSTDKLLVLEIDGARPSWEESEWNWRGLSGTHYKVILGPGNHTLRLEYLPGQTGEPKLETEPYLASMPSGSVKGLTNTISRIIFSWIMLPIAFIVILLLATYSLAYTLGGRGRIRIPVGV